MNGGSGNIFFTYFEEKCENYINVDCKSLNLKVITNSRSADVEPTLVLNCKDGHDHEIRCTAIGLFGFFLSILLIFCGLVVLVRLWVFKEIYYNFFVFSMLGVGCHFNFASINLTLFEGVVSISFYLKFS